MATISIMGDASGGINLTVPAAAGSHTLTLPTVTGTLLASVTPLTFPTSAGTSGQVLTTDGAGTLSWATPSGGAGTVTSVISSLSGITVASASTTPTLNGTLGTANGGTGLSTIGAVGSVLTVGVSGTSLTWAPPVDNIAIGTTTITAGSSNGLLFDNAGLAGTLILGTGVFGALGNAVNGASGFAVMNGSGVLDVVDGGTGLASLGTGVQIALGLNTNSAGGFPTLNGSGVLPIAQGGTGLSSLGTAGQVLTVNVGATAAVWAAPSDLLNVGVTTVTGGAAGSLLTEDAGGLLGEILMGTGVAAALAIDAGIADGLAIQASAFTQGSALFADASGKIAENNNDYFWDDGNTQLRVGTNTPVTSPADIQFVVSKDAYINGITAGRGDGQDSTNTVFGSGALATGGTSNNTAFGSNALNASSSGGLNAAFGSSALENNGGSGNTGVGHNALKTCSGSRNTAVGRFAMGFASVQGNQNTALGISALGFVTTGTDNVAVGSSSGSGITSGSSNVVIGSYTGASAPINATGDNFIVLSDGSANIGAYWDGTTGNQFCQGPVILKNYTFATLPTPPIQGMRAYITDASAAPVFLAVAAGGGTTVAPVFYDGTNWVFG